MKLRPSATPRRLQGRLMFRWLPTPGLGCVYIPAASMSVFNLLAVLLLLPLFDLVLMPALQRRFHSTMSSA